MFLGVLLWYPEEFLWHCHGDLGGFCCYGILKVSTCFQWHCYGILSVARWFLGCFYGILSVARWFLGCFYGILSVC